MAPRGTPKWEQELSSGAVCFNLCLAAQAHGFGAQWLTEWYAYDASVTAALGVGEGEQVRLVLRDDAKLLTTIAPRVVRSYFLLKLVYLVSLKSSRPLFGTCYLVSPNSSRPMSQRRISLVPAPISISFASRKKRPVG